MIQTRTGGVQSALNVTAAAVIKAAPGALVSILVLAPGTTSGSLTINDCLTTGAAASTNVLWTALYTALTVGQVITLNFPALVGIVVSAVPTAGSPNYNIFFN
jgi:hypothetical protein